MIDRTKNLRPKNAARYRAAARRAACRRASGLWTPFSRSRANGLGDKVESWVSKNTNKPISPGEMEQGLGADMVNWLTRETGMPKDQLLSGLAQHLPQAIDKLTPNGRAPTALEADQHLN